ncbi:SOS response-associated peptidase [Luteipulveratus flavus]|uniref:Abasic site processing protein n=1 Tax=Luteipulveratus flavus TaxID=3031728 RepID=A0ABT6C2N3_9MICO|nr:SOS response-associated peptidase family protein [Luteipulveratus sp. YIM 133296]MDF8263206.1 SOS response-associated peptidase family protein [Luteipulveratus sp. YIM 133296]
MGLRPHWLDEKRRGFHNARIETAGSKPAFRTAVARRRAVVPMSGYYEWVAQEDGKQPFYIHPADETGLLSAAGLYELDMALVGECRLTFTVPTRTGVDATGVVHDRMPVFLDEPARTAWIAPADLAATNREGHARHPRHHASTVEA